MGSVRVSSCRCCVFVSDASGDHLVEKYSSMGFVMDLYVAMIVTFCFPHVVDASDLSICIVLRAVVVVIFMCLLYVSLWSRKSVLVFWVDVHGECEVMVLFILCSAVLIEWLILKPCYAEMCVMLCVMLFVMYGSSVFSSVLLSLTEVRWVCMMYLCSCLCLVLKLV